MGWLDSLLGRRDAAPQRVVMVGAPQMGFTTSVTPTTSLGLSAVWRCLDVLSNGVSQLPWKEMQGIRELPPSRLVERPQADRTRREWVSLVVSTLALYDVCYLLKVGGVDREGVPLGLWPLDTAQVLPLTPTDTLLGTLPREFLVGSMRMSRDELVILHRSPQPAVSDTLGGILRLARTAFAGALAAEQYASRYWQSGGNPVIALETELHLTPDEAEQIQTRWAQGRSRGPDFAPVLSGGVKAHPFGADPTAESAVEARREMVADIGRYFGMPTRILNAPTGDSETYTSTESANLDLVRFTLRNYIGAIEDGITDLLPNDRYMCMDIGALSMGTQLSRAQAWQLALGSQPWMSPEEVRAKEGLSPTLPPSPNPGVVSGTVPVSVGGNGNNGAY